MDSSRSEMLEKYLKINFEKNWSTYINNKTNLANFFLQDTYLNL